MRIQARGMWGHCPAALPGTHFFTSPYHLSPMTFQPEDPTQLAKILLAHEKARARAWKEKNSRALEVLLAPDYLEITMLGRFSKKDILISLLPAISLHEFVISDPKTGSRIIRCCDPYLPVHRGS